MALEPQRFRGVVHRDVVQLEPGASLPEGAEVLVLMRPEARGVGSAKGVMGGDVCVRDTRIAVWTLVDYKQQGLSDEEILAAFPSLTHADLGAAWEYYAAHSKEIDDQRRRHEDAA